MGVLEELRFIYLTFVAKKRHVLLISDSCLFLLLNLVFIYNPQFCNKLPHLLSTRPGGSQTDEGMVTIIFFPRENHLLSQFFSSVHHSDYRRLDCWIFKISVETKAFLQAVTNLLKCRNALSANRLIELIFKQFVSWMPRSLPWLEGRRVV